jgi:hypothetical protein
MSYRLVWEKMVRFGLLLVLEMLSKEMLFNLRVS